MRFPTALDVTILNVDQDKLSCLVVTLETAQSIRRWFYKMGCHAENVVKTLVVLDNTLVQMVIALIVKMVLSLIVLESCVSLHLAHLTRFQHKMVNANHAKQDKIQCIDGTTMCTNNNAVR